MLKYTLFGENAVRRALREADKKIQRKVIRGGVRAAAQAFRKAIQANVGGLPITSEARARMKKSVVVATNVAGPPGKLIAGVTLRSVHKEGSRSADDPKVWHLWLEKGTAPRFHRSGKATGSIRAHPTVAPALRSAAPAAIRAAAEYMRARLEKEVAKRGT